MNGPHVPQDFPDNGWVLNNLVVEDRDGEEWVIWGTSGTAHLRLYCLWSSSEPSNPRLRWPGRVAPVTGSLGPDRCRTGVWLSL